MSRQAQGHPQEGFLLCCERQPCLYPSHQSLPTSSVTRLHNICTTCIVKYPHCHGDFALRLAKALPYALPFIVELSTPPPQLHYLASFLSSFP